MFVGYARVSLPEQHLALQTDALQRAGCERLYTDITGCKFQALQKRRKLIKVYAINFIP